MENLEGKIALVTGSGQGIGEAIAVELAACGAKVAVVDIELSRAQNVASQIESNGGTAKAMQADVSLHCDVQAMMQQLIETWGGIDILINNAGISPKDKQGQKIPILEMDPDQWDHVMLVNLKSVFLCTQAAGREMKKQKSGAIVNISSMVAKGGIAGPSGAHYCASKAGVVNFTINSARELCQYGIRVNSVAPGTIQTAQRAATSPEYNAMLMKNIPMGRFGLTSELAKAVAFIVSDSASYITGANLDVNGGSLMPW
jgi:3-oxoacyl-[acyl-carrier protein] reductase